MQATRESFGAMTAGGIDEVAEHYAQTARSFQARPVLIGHGLGGMLALSLAAVIHAAGVIAIDAMAVNPTASSGDPRARFDSTLSRDEFREVYGSAVGREESDRLYERWAIPTPRWAVRAWDMPGTRLPLPEAHRSNSSRSPMLLMASGTGRRDAARHYASVAHSELGALSDVVVFDDRGPSLVIDSRWRPVAESCLSWLDAQEL